MSARAIQYGSHREYDKEDFFTKQSTSQSERSIFDPDVITEADIERIWDKMKTLSARNRKYHRKRDANIISTDTTPTTDYEAMYFPLHPETLEEELELDRKKSKMEEVLRTKQYKPKTYLTQVILYDNVNHQRLLEKKLHLLQNRHKMVERTIKRRKETFVQQLESKQTEWTRLDARVAKKFEPEKMPDLSFKFGRLYHSADYPYQAAINTLRGIQVSKPEQSQKIRILPQVTCRKTSPPYDISDSDSGTSKVFITRLAKESKRNRPMALVRQNNEHSHHQDDTSLVGRQEQLAIYPSARREGLAPVRGRGQMTHREEKNWMQDSRYTTLTSILGDRFSPKKKLRSHNELETNLSTNLAW